LLAFYDNTFFQESFKVLKEKYHHKDFAAEMANNKVKFEVYGEEMLEKEIKLSGNSGRVYLPSDWVGHKVKIIRVD
jgi:putative transposon-encoded protein